MKIIFECARVKTTRIAGGLTWPYKGLLLAAPQGAAFHFVQAWCTDYLATPKGVFGLFCCYSIHHLIVPFLLSHIFRYSRFVQGNKLSVNVISSERSERDDPGQAKLALKFASQTFCLGMQL